MRRPHQDKNARLRDENTALKKTVHEQQDTIRKIYTKLARIEEDVKRGKDPSNILATVDIPGEYKGVGGGGGGGGGGGARKGKAAVPPPDKDVEDLITHLQKENITLKRKARQLEEKCKDLAVRKTALSRRPPATQSSRKQTPPDGRPHTAGGGGGGVGNNLAGKKKV